MPGGAACPWRRCANSWLPTFNLKNANMVLRLLPFLLLTLVLSDVYLYFKFMYGRRHPLWAYFLFFLPNALLLALALVLTLAESHTSADMTRMVAFFSLYVLVALPKTLFLVVDLTGKVVCLVFRRARKACTVVSSAASLLLFCVMGAGLSFGPSLLQVRRADFVSADLPPAFDGYRIVQFSDMHLASFRHRREMVGKVVGRIMEQRPDMIVFTGDLVSREAGELDGFDRTLAGLRAPDGVYSVLGNHDYQTYAFYLSPEEQAAGLEKLKERQRAMGWDLLLNERRVIRRGNDSIALVGVENDGKPPFPERGDLKKALAGLPGAGQGRGSARLFKVLLSHDPTHWRRKVLPQTDIQLTLSGHTHGMQFMLFGWSPSKYFYPEWRYMYREGARCLYVSLGVGEALVPIRFGAWPEINVITLHNK